MTQGLIIHYVSPTVMNWVQPMYGAGEYVDADWPWCPFVPVVTWPNLESYIWFGDTPGLKNNYSLGGFARQGRSFLKGWQRNYPTFPHQAWVWGTIMEYTCEITGSIPAAPAGATMLWATWKEVFGSTIRTVYKWPGDADCPVPNSSYVYVPEWMSGPDIGDWHSLCQPDEPPGEFWDYGPHSITSDYAETGIPPMFGLPEMEIWYQTDDPPDNGEDVKNVTDEEADLEAYNDCAEAWFEYNEKGHTGHHDTTHQYTTGLLVFHLSGLTPDTWYWYQFVKLCDGVEVRGEVFWFKTEKTTDPLALEIVTLPATEVWATGATIHGMLKVAPQNNPHSQYCYLGFQYGLSSGGLSSETIHWEYSGNYYSLYSSTNKYPFQTTIAGLLPDRTYYYRACLHVGTPPMTVNNYFGATLNFGGPVSIFGEGREYITAKKATDDVSKFAVGRYYMTKDGIFQYESRNHR